MLQEAEVLAGPLRQGKENNGTERKSESAAGLTRKRWEYPAVLSLLQGRAETRGGGTTRPRSEPFSLKPKNRPSRGPGLRGNR